MDPSGLDADVAEYWQRAEEDLQDCHDLMAIGKHRWALTALFYSALHRVNAYLQQRGRRPTSHDLRDRLLAQQMPDVADAYLRLKESSERARYWPDVQVTADDLAEALTGDYQTILQAISARLP